MTLQDLTSSISSRKQVQQGSQFPQAPFHILHAPSDIILKIEMV